MKSVVFCVCLFIASGHSFQPEFVRSFLNRPWMLTNQSLTDPATNKYWNQATLSIYVDNWSPHTLKLTGDEIRIGTFNTGLLPHDISRYGRELAARTTSSKENHQTSGLISWIVVDEKNVKLAILSVAWEVGNGIESRFTVKLSDDEPSFEDMWQKTKDNKMASTNQLDNTVYVGGISKLRFVAAANMTMNEGDTLHYRLRLSLVPSNIDVWGWVKYYREPHEASLAKIPPKKDPTSTQKKQEHSDQEFGLFEQKHLLDNDTELAILSKNNLTLRKALAYLDASIALGLLVENWSAYPLSAPTLEVNEGKVVENNHSIPRPNSVKAGTANVGIILQSKLLSGTSGVIRWTLGSTDVVLSVMWSVPYNRQLWRTWLAVGLSSHTDLPTYDQMYSKTDSRFIRSQSGQRFEFSDNRFIVIAEMDGDSTFKPVLRVGLVPVNNDLLAANIRHELGLKPTVMKPAKTSMESDFNYQKTQQHKNNDLPSVGLVQSSGSRTEFTLFCLSFFLLLV